MEHEKVMRDEMWEKIRREVETDLKASLRKELEVEYEAKLRQKEKEFEDRLAEIKATNKMEIKNSISTIYRLLDEKNSTSDVENRDTVSASTTEGQVEEIPPILRPEFEDFLRQVALELDPPSFLAFTGTSTRLRSLAKRGCLRTPLKLSCLTYEFNKSDRHSYPENVQQALVVTYNDKPLGYPELNRIRDAKYFNVKLEQLSVKEESRSGRRLLNANEKMFNTLDLLKVKNIDFAIIEANVDIIQLVQNFNIFNLTINRPPVPSYFLLAPQLSKIRILNFEIRDFDLHGNKELVEDFLLNSENEFLLIHHLISTALLTRVIKNWCRGCKNFRSIHIRTSVNGVKYLRQYLEPNFPKEYVDYELSQIERKRLMEIVDVNKPSILFGTDDGIVIIREDLAILRIASGLNRREGWWWMGLKMI